MELFYVNRRMTETASSVVRSNILPPSSGLSVQHHELVRLYIGGLQDRFSLRPTEGVKEMEPNLGQSECWIWKRPSLWAHRVSSREGNGIVRKDGPFKGQFLHAKHSDPEDGDSMFLRNVSICIQTT
jgi:hypothetical protein